MPRFLAQVTHGREDPERATLPFIVANVAASADQDAIVLLTIEGVWLATKGYADDIHHEGMQPLREVISALIAIEGARIIAAADLVAELASGTPIYTC